MTGSLKPEDYRLMCTLGRVIAIANEPADWFGTYTTSPPLENQDAWDQAVELMLIATGEERYSLRFEFEEGVRNNTRNMASFFRITSHFTKRVAGALLTYEESLEKA